MVKYGVSTGGGLSYLLKASKGEKTDKNGPLVGEP